MKLTCKSKSYILKHIISAIIILCITVVALPANVLADDKVAVEYDGITVDSFCGVPSVYITGIRNTDTGTYCCAQYVKNFYSAIYGANIFNLLPNQTPVNSDTGASLVQVSSPQPGDIGYQNTSSGLWHWFIVKSVNGDTATIIEQNWKWNEGGATYTCINRTVSPSSIPSLKYFRLSYDQAPAGVTETVIEETVEQTIAEQAVYETEYYEETITSEAYTEAIPETITEDMPETIAEDIPETITEAIPEESLSDDLTTSNTTVDSTVTSDIIDEPLLETQTVKLSEMNVDAISSAHPNNDSLEIVAGFNKLNDSYDSTALANDSLKNTISFYLVRNTLDLEMNRYDSLSNGLNDTTIDLAKINSVRNCVSDGSIIQHFELAFAYDYHTTSLMNDSIELAFR